MDVKTEKPKKKTRWFSPIDPHRENYCLCVNCARGDCVISTKLAAINRAYGTVVLTSMCPNWLSPQAQEIKKDALTPAYIEMPVLREFIDLDKQHERSVTDER